MEALLRDPVSRMEILQRLRQMGFLHLTPSGTAGGSTIRTLFRIFPTPSRTFPTPISRAVVSMLALSGHAAISTMG